MTNIKKKVRKQNVEAFNEGDARPRLRGTMTETTTSGNPTVVDTTFSFNPMDISMLRPQYRPKGEVVDGQYVVHGGTSAHGPGYSSWVGGDFNPEGGYTLGDYQLPEAVVTGKHTPLNRAKHFVTDRVIPALRGIIPTGPIGTYFTR